jgi:hypothetical protein
MKHEQLRRAKCISVGVCLSTTALFTFPHALTQSQAAQALGAFSPGDINHQNLADDPVSQQYTIGNTTYHFQTSANSDNALVERFNVGGTPFTVLSIADEVAFRRGNHPQFGNGNRQVIWYAQSELTSDNAHRYYAATRAEDPVNGPMGATLLGNNIHAGTDNLFVNQGNNASADQGSGGNNNNIERVDYIFRDGLNVTTTEQLDFGFVIFERGGNDPIAVAAIRALDSDGNPTAFGDMHLIQGQVNASNWGNTGYTVVTDVLNSWDTNPPAGTGIDTPAVSTSVGAQNIHGTFVALGSELGVGLNETIYGYALFAVDTYNAWLAWIATNPDPADRAANSVLVDYMNTAFFPTNTGDTGAVTGGGLDLVGGGMVGAPTNANTDGFLLPEPSSVVAGFLVLVGSLGVTSRRRARLASTQAAA